MVFTEERTAAQGAALLQAEEMARAAAYDSSPSRIGSMGSGSRSGSADGEEAASGTEGASIWGGAISAGSGSRGKVKPGAYHSPLDEIRHGNLCRLVGCPLGCIVGCADGSSVGCVPLVTLMADH